MRIERVVDAAAVDAGAHLFDAPPEAAATTRFLAAPGHHLLFAYDDADHAVGMISGVETTHPDKCTEMFLYELGVASEATGRGVATALIDALATLARDRGCYGMWVGTDSDNTAALAAYGRAGAREEGTFVMLSWDLTADLTRPPEGAAAPPGGPRGRDAPSARRRGRSGSRW